MILLEIIIAMLIVAAATLSSASMTLSGSKLNNANVAVADATDVMRQLVEELESHPFEELYARFNGLPDDDPDGAGTARGSQFTLAPTRRSAFLDVTAPAAPPTAKDAPRSTSFDVDIEFPEDVNGYLAEGVVGPLWGTQAWDIDGDGAPSSGDRSADYKLLPVAIRLSWADADGIHSMQVVRLLTKRQ